jgi:hypothetical protein
MATLYDLVYDVTRTAEVPAGALVILAVTMVGSLAVAHYGRSGKLSTLPPFRWFRIQPREIGVLGAIVAFVSFCTLCISSIEHSGRRRLVDAVAAGHYELVEGRVEDFVPGDPGGHHDEQWTVASGGRWYSYSYRRSYYEPGFRDGPGLIRAGQRVRLMDVDGQIARLEIARPEPSGAVAGTAHTPAGKP